MFFNWQKSKYIQITAFIAFSALFAMLFFTLAFSKTYAFADLCEVRADVTITYNGKSYNYYDKIIEPPDHLVAEEIYLRKINEPLADKLRIVDKCRLSGADMKNAMLYSFPLLEGVVAKIKKEVDTPFKNSEITFRPDKKQMFYISKEETGYELIEERLYHDIFINLKMNAKVRVPVIPKVLPPKITYKDNMLITKLRGSFSTAYPNSIENRRHNIMLAMKKINGFVLKDGEEFSFNGVVGARSERNGFKEAKIIVGGEYVEGVGGGVCQASTTLYNAALRAGMEITRVQNHSLPPSYVEPSFDAMVSSGSDMKFKNTTGRDVFIKTYVINNERAGAEIYGLENEYSIKTESKIIFKGDPPCDKEFVDEKREYVTDYTPEGERIRVSYGHGCIKSEGYIIKRDKKGHFVEKTLVRKDTYKESAGRVAVAPKPLKTVETEPFDLICQ